MKHLSTPKIGFGILITLVLAFSLHGGLAGAAHLPLTKVSGDFQTKPTGNMFEITFTVGVRSNTTPIRNARGQLVDESGKAATDGTGRIDTAGYPVQAAGNLVLRTTVSPTLTPPTGHNLQALINGEYVAPADTTRLADSSRNAYDGDGNPLYYFRAADSQADPPVTQSVRRATIAQDEFSPVTLNATRYHYNQEKIDITVSKDDATADTTSMTFRLKASGFQHNITELAEDPVNDPNGLPRSVTLICTPAGTGNAQAGKYEVRITDDTPVADTPWTTGATATYPGDANRAYIEFTLYVTPAGLPPATRVPLGAGGSTVLTVQAKEPVDTRLSFTGDDTNTPPITNQNVHYQVTKGNGTLYIGTLDEEYTTPTQDLPTHESSSVYLNTNRTTNEVTVTYAGQDPRTLGTKIIFEYIGRDRRDPTSNPTPEPEPEPQSTTLAVSPTSISGTAGSTHTLAVSASAGALISVGSLFDSFTTAGGTVSTASGTGSLSSILTLPSTAGTYTLTVFGGTSSQPAAVRQSVSVTVTAPTSGTVTVGIQPSSGNPGTPATVAVSAIDGSANPGANVAVTLSITPGGGTFLTTGTTTTTVTTSAAGTATATLTRGTTPGSNYYITASPPTGYTFRSALTSGERLVISGAQQPSPGDQQPPTGGPTSQPVGSAALISAYEGNNQEGSPNIRLLSPLVVEVVDANDNPVPNVRVRFRTTIGSGTFTPRTVRTDAEGFAEVRFTPTSTGRIRVIATVTGVSRNAVFFVQGGELASGLLKVSGDNQNGTQGEALSNPFIVEVQDAEGDPLSDRTVSFHVTAGGGSLSEASVRTGANGRAETLLTLGNQRGVHSVQASVPGVDPVTFTARIEPQILVAAANRPVMYWTDDGMLYRLAEKVEHIAVSLENATSWAIGGSKLYWTMTNATNPNRGTLNSANLDGSGATQLNDIYGAPYEIAVDVTKGKLYWTDSLNRIQQSDLSGQNIKNAVRDISGLGTLAVAAGNVYWTEDSGRIRSANINGGTPVTPILASGLGNPLSLAVGGNKLYWLERAANGSGKLQRANLDGTGVEVLKSFTRLYDNSLSVDTTRQHLYLAGSGKVSRRNLTGTGYQVVVSGLGNPMSIAIGGTDPAGTATQTPTQKATDSTSTALKSKYDLNGDGVVDNTDAGLVSQALNTTNAKYDVNDDGVVNFLDLLLVFDNRDAGAAGAPTLLGMKLTAAQVAGIEEQIEMLIATGDRSPAAMRTLIYLQQLLATARPGKTQLLANYPNPFNPETWIPYELATDTDVRITIYNAQGVVIRTLQLGQQAAGYYTDRERAAYWDGRNALGEQVASGIYFYQLETDTMSSMRKMVILK